MKRTMILSIMLTSMLFAKGAYKGEVLETMESGGYTYMKVSDGGKSYWIAASKIDIKKGAKIAFSEEMTMQKFHSKTLNRTFESIMFVSEVHGQGEKVARTRVNEQNIHVTNALADTLKKVKISPFKEDGTLGVAETYEKAKSLRGKKVKIRGKVTKVSHMIMGKNWIHIQDGTGDSHTDDIVFTSKKGDAKAGDIVTAEGTLATDKDFGYGYFYPVILEESTFTK